MTSLEQSTDEELQYRIMRCKVYLSGVMPIGIMNELEKKRVTRLDFK